MAKSNAKAANNGGQKYPCTYPDGHIEEVTYSHVKERNEAIIEDNIVYGLIHPEYSDAEIKKYEKEARAQQRSFLAFLREFPGAKIMYSWHTEMYEAISYGLSTRQETF